MALVEAARFYTSFEAHVAKGALDAEGIPAILLAIGIVGGLLTVAYASAFTPTRYNMFMTSGIAVTLGLLFLFILTVNYPYKGEFSVSNRLLAELPADFDRLDRTALRGQSVQLR